MNTGGALYYILNNDATLTGLLGTGKRLYVDNAEQSTPNPCIVYSERAAKVSTKDAAVNDNITWQIDVYSDSTAQRDNIAARVRTLLDRYSGTVNTIKIQQVDFENDYRLYDDESNAYRSSMDFTVRQVL